MSDVDHYIDVGIDVLTDLLELLWQGLILLAELAHQLVTTLAMSPEGMGVAAGLLQLWGYIIYLRKVERPNPLTWLMFGYGTLILTVLEWDKGATNAELMLPMVCTALGLYVMAKAWRRALRERPAGTYRGLRRFWPDAFWPEDTWECRSFGTDLTVTAGYVLAWGLATFHILDMAEVPSWTQYADAGWLSGGVAYLGAAAQTREFWLIVFLVASNLTVFSEFYPLLRETWKRPQDEHPLPWFIWTVSYSTLGWVTFMTHGFWSWLMLYPVLNALMHGMTALVALRRPPPHTCEAETCLAE